MTSPTHENPAEPRHRFCTQCGAELAEGARFCTECGAVIEGASPRERSAAAEVPPAPQPAPPAAGPVPPEPPAPTPGAPRRRRGVVVAAVLAALVLLAAGGAAVTRVMGLWGTGSDAPDAPAGTDELPDTDPVRKGKYAAFLAMLRDLEAEHGPATVVSGGASSFPDARWLDGLCFAKVLDFGDGVERLVVAYGAEDSLDESYPGDWYAYTVEVWEYSEGTDDLVSVWRGNMSFSNGGYASLSFSESQDGSARYYVVSVPDANNTVVGVRDDGSFGVVTYLEASPGGPNGTVRYLVDGLEVSEDEYWATSDRYGIGLTTYGSGTTYSLAAYGSPDMGDPEATAQVAKDTRATLEALAGDLLDADPDE